MPTEVKGVTELRAALRKFAPDLNKELLAEFKTALQPVTNKAKSFVPSTAPGNLFGWDKNGKGKWKPNYNGRLRQWPRYDASLIKAGIKYKTSPSLVNRSGFKTLVRIQNKSSVGAILETAGRLNKDGQPHVGRRPGSNSYSHSNNPEAGAQFIRRAGKLYGEGQVGSERRYNLGRLIYRAWYEDNGKANAAVFRAIENADKKFQARTTKGAKSA